MDVLGSIRIWGRQNGQQLGLMCHSELRRGVGVRRQRGDNSHGGGQAGVYWVMGRWWDQRGLRSLRPFTPNPYSW